MTGSWKNAFGVLESPGILCNRESGNADVLCDCAELRLLPKSRVAVIVDNMHNDTAAGNQSLHNRPGSGQCCACPKTKEQQRIEDEERQFQIEFENFLQDTLYRKG